MNTRRRKSRKGGEKRVLYLTKVGMQTREDIIQKNKKARESIESAKKSLEKANKIIDKFTTARKLQGKNKPERPKIYHSEIQPRDR